MCTSYPQLSAQVDKCIASLGDYFAACAGGTEPDEIKKKTVYALLLLTRTFGTDQYGFNLSMEYFVEKLPDGLRNILGDMLAEMLPYIKKSHTPLADVAFAVSYALSLIYKKEQALEELGALIGTIFNSALTGYPLVYEIRARYYKRVKAFTKALSDDEMAIDLLENRGTVNYAAYISFASTVCKMYKNDTPVWGNQARRAMEYIDIAIGYNPDYAKYHYLKGALLYYTNLDEPDVGVFCEICLQADKHLRAARIKLHDLYGGQGAHFESELKSYNNLIDEIYGQWYGRQEAASRRSAQKEELERRKEKIRTWAESGLHGIQPRMPSRKPGEKYFFISYTTADYKAVFCDLEDLYFRGVPFVYDETLNSGEDWAKQVRRLIASDDCCGVVFYISRNSLLSTPIETEIRMVTEEFPNLPYFCVNLEGKTAPSEILIQTIREFSDADLRAKGVDGKRMSIFLKAFPDNVVYTPRPEQVDTNGERSAGYIGQFIGQIEKMFPGIRTGSKVMVAP